LVVKQNKEWLQVNIYENRLDQIRSIHHECDDPIDWQEIYHRLEPYKNGQDGPNTMAARPKQQAYQPGVMDRLFNFTQLDPSDALVNFPHKMKFKKTHGFEDLDDIIH